ncbi:hypothetical protein N9195_01055 [bacterium]|nr:hypothetical protein [bacterium]
MVGILIKISALITLTLPLKAQLPPSTCPKVGGNQATEPASETLYKVNDKIRVIGTQEIYKKWDGTKKAIITIDQMPKNTREGDLVILMVAGSGGKTDSPAPAGTWSLINRVWNVDIFVGAYYKVYSSTGPKTFHVGRSNKRFAALTTLRGVDISDPIVDSKTDSDSSPLRKGAVAPGVKSVAGGALFVGFAMDNPVVYQQGDIQKMEVLFSYGPGWPGAGNVDDALTGAVESTIGGSTGKRTARLSDERGHCNGSEISISLKPAP